MKTLLIVYHSMTGGALQMASAAAGGAGAESAVKVSMLRAADAQAADLLNAAGFIFAAPENLAAMSGQMKDFFDRTYYEALERLNGRPYAALICAGSDGRNAAQQIQRIAAGWRLRPVADPSSSARMPRLRRPFCGPSTFPRRNCGFARNWGRRWPPAWHWAFSERGATMSGLTDSRVRQVPILRRRPRPQHAGASAKERS